MITAITSIVAPSVALKLDTATLLASSNRETRALVTMALLATIVISSLWAWVSQFLTQILTQSDAPTYTGLWVFGLTLLTGLFSIFSQLALRNRRYGQVASRTMLQAVGTASSQSAFGVMSLGQVGLLAGHILGRLVGILALLPVATKYFGKHRFAESVESLRKYWRFPIVFAPSAVINATGLQLPLLTLTAIYGLEFAGQLGMAERIISAPVGLVGGAIGQMFMSEIAKMRREANPLYFRFFMQLSLFLFCSATVGFGLLALTAHWLIPWALGQNWTEAIPLVQVVAITGTFRLVATPMSRAISVFERAKANLWLDITRVALLIAAMCVVYEFNLSEIAAVWVLYGSLAIVYLITWCYVWVLLRAESRPSQNGSLESDW
jgi:O-antigen/teichoic acid export membrane protein